MEHCLRHTAVYKINTVHYTLNIVHWHFLGGGRGGGLDVLFSLQVKVMVRICSAQGSSNTSESRSFLKVDARKKQLTLCETSANSHSSAAQRRAAAAAPKMFAFDAVFSQDASQVSHRHSPQPRNCSRNCSLYIILETYRLCRLLFLPSTNTISTKSTNWLN